MRAGLVAMVGSLAFALGACGHSGSGTLSRHEVTVPFQSANTSTAYNAASATASFTAGTGITATGAPEPADTAGNTVTLDTDKNGGLSSLTVNIGTTNGGAPTASSVTISNGIGDGGFASAWAIAALAGKVAESGSVPEIVYQGRIDGLSYSAFGLWMQNTGGTNYNVGTFALGTPETATMPTTGTATYYGTALGFGANGAAPFAFTGRASIGVDFATSSVTAATFSNFVTQDVNDSSAGPTLPTLTGSGAIAGNKYSLSVTGGSLTGTAAGTFYGPAAEETAGVFQATGGGISLLGSFGAHR